LPQTETTAAAGENRMAILVVGSVALDSVKTPSGAREDILGGSATYFGIAASYFTDVSMVAVVGEDFPETHISLLLKKGMDLSGLQRKKGKTFRWKGEYGPDFNMRTTLDTQLNVFADFSPRLLEAHRSPDCVFLGNIDPDLQRSVLEQVRRPRLVACDTMNYWIQNKRDALLKTLTMVDLLIINDAETLQLAEQPNLIQAAKRVLGWGPKILVIKRGEYGALLFNAGSVFSVPAYPVEDVVDPTGAGDSFAGGLVGYLAVSGASGDAAMRKAVVFGSAMASFNVTGFGPGRLTELTYPEIVQRYREFRKLVLFEDI
jgi:sugar/nucleoside kinase (ribokinase family)